MVDMDNKALDSSVVFKEYEKIQKINDLAAAQAAEVDEDKILTAFAEFEREIQKDPRKLRAFRALQEKFSTDLTYREQVNPLFVEGIMMLNLDGQD